MNIREIYEQLLEGNQIVLEFSSRNDYLSVYSQLRSIKSRFDASFKALSGQTVSGGKVIRAERLVGDSESYKFSLADRKVIEKIQFKILDIIPDAPVNDPGIQLALPEPYGESGDLLHLTELGKAGDVIGIGAVTESSGNRGNGSGSKT